MYNTKNYKEQGGNESHFGGKVVFEEGCQIEGLPQMVNLPSDSSIADIISAMKDAGLMYSAEWSIDASLAPTPTEDVLVRNKAKVVSVSCNDGTVTVVVDPDELEESASSDPSQGTHKWLALEIATGVNPITEVSYNGYALTEQDITDAQVTGCSEGSFVLYIKSEEVLLTPKAFTLSADEHYEVTVTISVQKPEPQIDWEEILTNSVWDKNEGEFSESDAALLLNNTTGIHIGVSSDDNWTLEFQNPTLPVELDALIEDDAGTVTHSSFTLSLLLSENSGVYSMTLTDSQNASMSFIWYDPNRDASYFNVDSEGVISKKSGVDFPENLRIPLEVNGTDVASVSSCGQDSSLGTLVVPAGVNLEAQAFSGSPNLETVEFKGGNNVGDYAFATCPSLERVEFEGTGNNMSLIAMDANCSATVVFDGIQYSTFESFKYGQLGHEYEQYFEFEENTSIWLKEDVTLPETLVTPNTLDGIRVTRVGFCYESPNLETLVVNEGLRVNPGAFYSCPALKSILFLGGNILDDSVFISCDAIERVEFKGTGYDISTIAFDDDLYATFIYEGRVFDTFWSLMKYIRGKEFEQYFDIDARGVVSKKSEATFTSYELIIPVSVNGLDVTGIDVIGPLSGVSYLGIPKGVSVEDGAFANSIGSGHVVFGGDNVIGTGAFSGCSFNKVDFYGEITDISATSFDALPTTTFKYKGTNYTGFASFYAAWQAEQSQ